MKQFFFPLVIAICMAVASVPHGFAESSAAELSAAERSATEPTARLRVQCHSFSVTAEKNARREVVLWGNLPEIPAAIDPLPTFEHAEPLPDEPKTPLKLVPAGGWSPLMLGRKP